MFSSRTSTGDLISQRLWADPSLNYCRDRLKSPPPPRNPSPPTRQWVRNGPQAKFWRMLKERRVTTLFGITALKDKAKKGPEQN